MATKTKAAIKLIGEIAWVPEEKVQGPTEVKRAIFRPPDEIVFDCVSQGANYNIKLNRIRANRFEGTWSSRNFSDKATCRLYSNEEGYVLIGKWVEDGSDYFWWAEVHEVDLFPDEKG